MGMKTCIARLSVPSRLATIWTLASETEAQTVVMTRDCTQTKDCPDWGHSCLKKYKAAGGTANFFQFAAKYPCCVCNPDNNNTRTCARGGIIEVDGAKIGNTMVGIAAIRIDRSPKLEEFKEVNCAMSPNCTQGDFCKNECVKAKGNGKLVNQRYKCCVCEPPESGCENCFCAAGNVLRITLMSSRDGKEQVGDSEMIIYPETVEAVVPPSNP